MTATGYVPDGAFIKQEIIARMSLHFENFPGMERETIPPAKARRGAFAKGGYTVL